MPKTYTRTAVAIAVLALAACSPATKTTSEETESAKKEAAGPPEPVTAKTAYWEMYRVARTWATDLVPLKVVSKELPGFKNDAGKAAMWEATIASPTKHEYRIFTYSIAAKPPDIYKGPVVGGPMPWGGPTREVMPFRFTEVAVDSDAAYKTAMSQAGPWVQKHPDKTAMLQLWNPYRFQIPMWYILWGDTKSGYAVYVNAKTGTALKPTK